MTNTIMLETRFSIVNLGMKLVEPENHYRFTYLSFQALMKYTRGTGLAVKAGPYIDYGIAGVQKTPSGNTVKVFKEEAINRLNTGIAVGAGYSLMMGNMPVEVFASYRIGLNDTEGKYDLDNQKATLRMLSIGLTSALPF